MNAYLLKRKYKELYKRYLGHVPIEFDSICRVVEHKEVITIWYRSAEMNVRKRKSSIQMLLTHIREHMYPSYRGCDNSDFNYTKNWFDYRFDNRWLIIKGLVEYIYNGQDDNNTIYKKYKEKILCNA